MAEKPSPIRYHFDEHMDPEIARALQRAGIDVSTTLESGLRTKVDESHMDYARSKGRVLVTDDTDFLRFSRTSNDHPGIVFCRRTKHSMREIIRFLKLLYEVSDADDMRGRVEYLG